MGLAGQSAASAARFGAAAKREALCVDENPVDENPVGDWWWRKVAASAAQFGEAATREAF